MVKGRLERDGTVQRETIPSTAGCDSNPSGVWNSTLREDESDPRYGQVESGKVTVASVALRDRDRRREE